MEKVNTVHFDGNSSTFLSDGKTKDEVFKRVVSLIVQSGYRTREEMENSSIMALLAPQLLADIMEVIELSAENRKENVAR